MAKGRSVLLFSMVLAAPLLWWSGVTSTVSRARVDLPTDDQTLVDALSSYRSAALVLTGFYVLINLLLILSLLPNEQRLRQGRVGTIIRAVIGVVLVTGAAWFEHRFNPVTSNWSGEADASSMVRDHARAWDPAVGILWIVTNGAAAASVAVRAIRAQWESGRPKAPSTLP
ncbi:hypothetical protein [Micromonospora profundi]|uniref:hypothetical protein n=1 Tax=Micromonospora TaxID=1873 RepID=UPI0033BB5C71